MKVDIETFVEITQKRIEAAIEEMEDREDETTEVDTKEYYRGMQFGLTLALRHMEIVALEWGVRVM